MKEHLSNISFLRLGLKKYFYDIDSNMLPPSSNKEVMKKHKKRKKKKEEVEFESF